MRILNITNLLPPFYVGGYELICDVVSKELIARGHEVRILTSDHGLDRNPKPDNEPHVERSLRVHGFFGNPWLKIAALRELEIHNNSVVRKAVESFKPDVVYVWNLGGISKSILHTLNRLGVPVANYMSDHWIARSLVADVWLDWWNRKSPSLPARLLRFAWTVTGMRKSWDVIAPTQPVKDIKLRRLSFCSRALKNITIAKGYDVRHAAVIHCPVNTKRFHGTPVAADRPLRNLLYVGRLAEDKGTMTALRAMLAIKDKFDGMLRIYGKGDVAYTEKLKAFVNHHQLPVTFHSGTAEEMPDIYRAHDALIFTSEWEEPFALTPLEAMACGLPVIGTMTGGSAELFRDGGNALTYRAGHADELAAKILELAGSGDLRHNLAVNGQVEVSHRCAEPVIVDQIEEYLKETIALWPQLLEQETAKQCHHNLNTLAEVGPVLS
jgi:glycosyltransferase involved in cell wall biosynthesis